MPPGIAGECWISILYPDTPLARNGLASRILTPRGPGPNLMHHPPDLVVVPGITIVTIGKTTEGRYKERSMSEGGSLHDGEFAYAIQLSIRVDPALHGLKPPPP